MMAVYTSDEDNIAPPNSEQTNQDPSRRPIPLPRLREDQDSEERPSRDMIVPPSIVQGLYLGQRSNPPRARTHVEPTPLSAEVQMLRSTMNTLSRRVTHLEEHVEVLQQTSLRNAVTRDILEGCADEIQATSIMQDGGQRSELTIFRRYRIKEVTYLRLRSQRGDECPICNEELNYRSHYAQVGCCNFLFCIDCMANHTRERTEAKCPLCNGFLHEIHINRW